MNRSGTIRLLFGCSLFLTAAAVMAQGVISGTAIDETNSQAPV